MPKGIVKKLLLERRFGFIQPAAGGPDVWFHANSVRRPAQFGDLTEGQDVDYDVQQAERGPQATSVRIVGQAAPRRAEARQPGAYRFLNPYNFVRVLSAVSAGKTAQPETTLAAKLRAAAKGTATSQVKDAEKELMGKCAPPPHDRYLGLTGRVTCTVEAVTPLFVSDSHGVEKHGEHRSYEFFKLEGKPALPATSLRGMVRSVFEAVTNSCFSQLTDARLSHRLVPGEALRLIPARVESRERRKLRLRLLPGTTQPKWDSRPDGPQYAAWVPQYLPPMQPSRSIPGQSSYGKRAKVSLHGLKHGEDCWALLEPMAHPRRAFEFWSVLQLAKSENELPQPKPPQRRVPGYLCITDQNIENKHDERLFFAAPEFAGCSAVGDEEVAKNYHRLIRDYQERHKDQMKKRKNPGQREGKEPAFSRFIRDKSAPELKVGDLVYALLEDYRTVRLVAPVSIPRVIYDRAIPELLPDPEHLGACKECDQLCPACRVFGWVRQEDKEEGGRVAYAGRVSFSHASLRESKGVLDPTPLAILSSPKPTTTRFYLTPKNGHRPTWEDKEGYDGEVFLRGRKFYRHHGKVQEQEYRRAEGRCDDQNRTVRDALLPGAKFEFCVSFENLAPVELGALLWALGMDGKGFHRLGFAKPLGFGSVNLEVKEVRLLDAAVRYRSLSDSGWVVCRDWPARFVTPFWRAMAERYGQSDFEQLDNVKDLHSLLSDPPEALPIHYPRTGPRPDPEGKNFDWFLGNNRKPKYTLPPASADAGLPLIGRDGTES